MGLLVVTLVIIFVEITHNKKKGDGIEVNSNTQRMGSLINGCSFPFISLYIE
jgi:hypothetical protein